MPTYSNPAGSTRTEILDRLRTLRGSIAQARTALLHFQDDRLDRDKLEPAAALVLRSRLPPVRKPGLPVAVPLHMARLGLRPRRVA